MLRQKAGRGQLPPRFPLYHAVSLHCGDGVLAIMLIDGWAGFTDVIFEVFSAIGTVGLSLGITPDLHVASQMILALLMYLGRVGCLTFMLMFKDVSAPTAELPHEAVRIG